MIAKADHWVHHHLCSSRIPGVVGDHQTLEPHLEEALTGDA